MCQIKKYKLLFYTPFYFIKILFLFLLEVKFIKTCIYILQQFILIFLNVFRKKFKNFYELKFIIIK